MMASTNEGMNMRSKRLTVQQRKDIFRDLVETQDSGIVNVPQSRQTVMKHFGITEAQLRQIEDEGLEKEWPPLETDEEEKFQRAG
jgi:hypothetical protein